MAHFHGTVEGNGGPASRCGTKISGLTTYASSGYGAIRVEMWYDEELKCNRFQVNQVTWNDQGVDEPLCAGILGQPNTTRHTNTVTEP